MLNTAEVEFSRLLAERIRSLRMHHALSQRDLAIRAGVARQVVINAESGSRLLRPSSLRKIARALDVKPVQLTQA
ncbi:MAG TPA: helix-turn-helix transcriptional regulator [Chloroflexota bacterium]|nr:helix-turn-helix transcriptional regulator [Chloroflexota bacterium]